MAAELLWAAACEGVMHPVLPNSAVSLFVLHTKVSILHVDAEVDTVKCPCRAEEDVGPYLPAARRGYVFGSLAAQAARIIIWLLPEVQVSLPAASVAGTAPPELWQAADHCCW